MKRSVLLIACFAVTACEQSPVSSVGTVPPPAAVANQTVLDEKIGAGAELIYKASNLAMTLAVDSGKLHGAKASQAADLDNRLFDALKTVRSAYRAGNATDYLSAAVEVSSLATQLTGLIEGEK